MKAYVTYDNGELRAALDDGREIRAADPHELADRLFAAGVTKEEVAMPDWRAGDQAPHGGAKIALYARLAQLRAAASDDAA